MTEHVLNMFCGYIIMLSWMLLLVRQYRKAGSYISGSKYGHGYVAAVMTEHVLWL